MIKAFPIAAAAAALALACACEMTVELQAPEAETTVLTVALANTTRTTLGPSAGGERKVYWSDGDRLCLNGVTSDALADVPAESSSATFTFAGVLSAPYKLLYPASFYKNESTITLPAVQSYAAGSFAPGAEPLAGYTASAGAPVSLGHLCSIIQISILKDAGVAVGNIATVKFSGRNGEQVCGDFTIDYEAPSISPAGSGSELTLNVGQPLSESIPLDLYLVVPSGSYDNGFTVTIEDDAQRSMAKMKSSAITLTAGRLTAFPSFTFVPSAYATEFELDSVYEEVLLPDDFNVTGRVVDNLGNGLEGVVVSDGIKCVKTMIDGTFYIDSAIANVSYVFVSTPTGYMPAVSGGIPRFYKAKADVTPVGGIYDFGDFVLTPVANPNRFTLLITADPQPRKNNWYIDRIAYKSLDVCDDLYQELYDVASSIGGRQVYGICLGDIVHESMSLYSNYATALGTLPYPTYNVIGNHDNDPDAADDDAAAATFESYFGPRNYSFNIGGIHFVVLDNLMMKDNGEGKLSAFDQGLTDQNWAWLQNDMAMIPTSTTVMVCAHSPMFKQQSGSERTNTAYHAGTRSDKDGGAFGYGDLFDKYTEVHAWAGHTHSGFNYIYASNHRHKRIQVHTLARSTGELWTNDYLANGTPRGFTVVEVDNGNISWKFHPVTRQRGAFQGVTSGFCPAGAPAYEWRAWDYNGSGVAVMKAGGGALDESYQMNVYPRGAYGDNCVYANVFLWDEKWENPVWTPDGGAPVEMTRIYSADKHDIIPDVENVYDMGDTEFRTWYKTYADVSGASLHDMDGYTPVATESDGKITTLFRAPAAASPSSGTVSVTDRFGNVYSCNVSW